jgi:hypothetical protein
MTSGIPSNAMTNIVFNVDSLDDALATVKLWARSLVAGTNRGYRPAPTSATLAKMTIDDATKALIGACFFQNIGMATRPAKTATHASQP